MPKVDYGNVASGVLAGAATGSAFGPIGSAVGGLGGGLLGLFSKRKKKKKISTLDKNQTDLYDKYTQGINGKGDFAGLFNFDSKSASDLFTKTTAQPAYKNFKENVIPGITGQFRGGNLQNSSYLAGALSKAGTDVQTNLDNQLAQMLHKGQEDSVNRRINGLNGILNMQTFAYEKPQNTAIDNATQAFAGGAGQVAGNKFAEYLKPKV